METSTIIKDNSNYLTAEQVDRMLENAPNEDVWLLILLLFRTGRRVSEVLNLRPMYIDYDNNLIQFTILKKRPSKKELKAQYSETMEVLKLQTLHVI